MKRARDCTVTADFVTASIHNIVVVALHVHVEEVLVILYITLSQTLYVHNNHVNMYTVLSVV